VIKDGNTYFISEPDKAFKIRIHANNVESDKQWMVGALVDTKSVGFRIPLNSSPVVFDCVRTNGDERSLLFVKTQRNFVENGVDDESNLCSNIGHISAHLSEQLGEEISTRNDRNFVVNNQFEVAQQKFYLCPETCVQPGPILRNRRELVTGKFGPELALTTIYYDTLENLKLRKIITRQLYPWAFQEEDKQLAQQLKAVEQKRKLVEKSIKATEQRIAKARKTLQLASAAKERCLARFHQNNPITAKKECQVPLNTNSIFICDMLDEEEVWIENKKSKPNEETIDG
jgi:hypothetical protein